METDEKLKVTPISWEPGTWICERCGSKNYFPIGSDIMITGNKMYVWDPNKGEYREEDIKCSKCGALLESMLSLSKEIECPFCHKKFTIEL